MVDRAARAAKAAKAARLEANRVTASKAVAVAAGAPRRNWDTPTNIHPAPARTPSPQPAQRRFTKTIASPGRLPTESSDVVFQGVRSPHIFMVQDDFSDDEMDCSTRILTGGDTIPVPAIKTRVELQERGSVHVHNI